MKATLPKSERIALRQGGLVELVLWRVPAPLKGSTHSYKHRLALVADGICVLRYDNEAGKGDHRHIGDREEPYSFRDTDKLLQDFRMQIGDWLDENGRA